MPHNPIECAKCGRGYRVKPHRMAVYSYFVCCKTAELQATPQVEKPDPELSAARADHRQMWLPLTPEELQADSLGSFNEAIRVIAERYKAGEHIPATGYFARKEQS